MFNLSEIFLSLIWFRWGPWLLREGPLKDHGPLFGNPESTVFSHDILFINPHVSHAALENTATPLCVSVGRRSLTLHCLGGARNLLALRPRNIWSGTGATVEVRSKKIRFFYVSIKCNVVPFSGCREGKTWIPREVCLIRGNASR